MWTKRYIFKPTKEEYFKTKHPIAIASMLVPMILYYLTITFAGADRYNWWIMVGFVGCLVFGIGLVYAFAVKIKIYQKVLLPTLCLLFGAVLIVVTLLFFSYAEAPYIKTVFSYLVNSYLLDKFKFI